MGVLLVVTGLALAESPAVPSRQIPASVLAELSLLENRFELALAADCAAERCFSKGCTYIDHAVIDRPRSSSLPGFSLDPGPGSVASQEFLTQARCSFAHEAGEEAGDIATLTRRVQTRLTAGWLVVSVDGQSLQPLPEYLREPPAAEEAPEVAEEAPEVVEEPDEWWTMAVAGRELWTTLLPHFFWMIAVGLMTLAGITLIWAFRRVGQASIEEQALLAQMTGTAPEPTVEGDGAVVEEVADDPEDFVRQQHALWTARLEANPRDPEVSALVRELLRTGELALLARAVLTFPERFPGVFPSGGELAAAKIELADYLKTVDADTLPSDVEFFTALERHALSAALLTQADARVVRSLREEFGAAGLVAFIDEQPARIGALLFALSPADKQHEMVALLTAEQAEAMASALLHSNRMDPDEAATVFDVLEGAAPSGAAGAVLDRGAAFDAAAALSVLLPRLSAAQRAELFAAALRRLHGSLPSWYRGILTADMLMVLDAESRADLLLSVDLETLAAWLSLLDSSTRALLLDGLPETLRTSVQAASVFPSRARQVALAERGRVALASGFQQQLARAGIPFEHTVRPSGAEVS